MDTFYQQQYINIKISSSPGAALTSLQEMVIWQYLKLTCYPHNVCVIINRRSSDTKKNKLINFDLAFEWKRGWKCLRFDTNLTAFHMKSYSIAN